MQLVGIAGAVVVLASPVIVFDIDPLTLADRSVSRRIATADRRRIRVIRLMVEWPMEVMGISEVITTARSPWQNPYVKRVIGSIPRECLDHLIVFNERHLRRVLWSYADYYHHTCAHLSPDKDCPHPRNVQRPHRGWVIGLPHVGGLHHRYERLAAQSDRQPPAYSYTSPALRHEDVCTTDNSNLGRALSLAAKV